MIILFTLLIFACAFAMLWCGQDRDSGRQDRDAGSSRVEDPVKGTVDARATPDILEAGASSTTDAGLDGSTVQSPDAEVSGATSEADASPSTEPDATPTKAEPAQPEPTDGGSSKAPEEVTKAVDASPQPEEDPTSSVDPQTKVLTSLLQKVYNEVDSFEADFEQTYRNRLLDRTRESKGHVWLRPPSKMRWEYAPPSKNLIVADGRTLFVYEPEPNQVVKMPVSGSELPSVMAFLTGGRNLSADYNVREVHREELTPRGQAGLELRPKAPSSVVSRVVLVISRQTGKVQRTVLVEPEGNTNTFVWSKVKTNVTIPSRQFTFTPPAGVRVVER